MALAEAGVNVVQDAEIGRLVESFHDEVRALLPALSSDVRVELDLNPSSPLLIPGLGVGGFTTSRERVSVLFDPSFAGDRQEQLRRLRGAVFHECFHAAHGFTADDIDLASLAALHDAVFEGAATVFERDRAGSDPPWGRYLDEETMLTWLRELAGLAVPYDIMQWKFFHAATRRQWIVYRVGTFVVDRALSRRSGLTVEELASIGVEEVLEIAGVPG